VAAVRQRSILFFQNYRQSHHHSQLQGRSPAELHQSMPIHPIPDDFTLPKNLPLTDGQIHFIRAVDEQRRVQVLNIHWDVPLAQSQQGVWVTIKIASPKTTLFIYDDAPDVSSRKMLAQYPFPAIEKVTPPLMALKDRSG
jgi:hypothetical protein